MNLYLKFRNTGGAADWVVGGNPQWARQRAIAGHVVRVEHHLHQALQLRLHHMASGLEDGVVVLVLAREALQGRRSESTGVPPRWNTHGACC